MKIRINGENRETPAGMTIGQILDQLNLCSERVVLELNRTILNASDCNDTALQDGDQLEIIQFVGGG